MRCWLSGRSGILRWWLCRLTRPHRPPRRSCRGGRHPPIRPLTRSCHRRLQRRRRPDVPFRPHCSIGPTRSAPRSSSPGPPRRALRDGATSRFSRSWVEPSRTGPDPIHRTVRSADRILRRSTTARCNRRSRSANSAWSRFDRERTWSTRRLTTKPERIPIRPSQRGRGRWTSTVWAGTVRATVGSGSPLVPTTAAAPRTWPRPTDPVSGPQPARNPRATCPASRRRSPGRDGNLPPSPRRSLINRRSGRRPHHPHRGRNRGHTAGRPGRLTAGWPRRHRPSHRQRITIGAAAVRRSPTTTRATDRRWLIGRRRRLPTSRMRGWSFNRRSTTSASSSIALSARSVRRSPTPTITVSIPTRRLLRCQGAWRTGPAIDADRWPRCPTMEPGLIIRIVGPMALGTREVIGDRDADSAPASVALDRLLTWTSDDFARCAVPASF